MNPYQKQENRRRSGYNNRKKSDFPELLLFYVLPFLVFNSILFFCVVSKPKVEVVVADTNDYLSTQVTMTIKSWFPTKSITMTLDGEEQELEKGKKRTYTATVYKNGSIEANVVNINGMPATVFEHVNVLDDNPPSFEQADILDGIVTIKISDSQSGVNFDSIYALDSQNQQVAPLTVDRNSNILTYEMDAAGLHVFAQDKAANEVQGNFTSHKDGNVETLEGGAVDAEGNFIIGEEEEETSTAAPSSSSSETDETPQIVIN